MRDDDIETVFIDVTPRGFVATPSGLLVPEALVKPRRVLALDLFAGCGGFSLGFHQAGIHVIGAVEMEFTAAHTYMVNLARPGVRIHFDTEERGEAFDRYLRKAWKLEGKGQKKGIVIPGSVAGSGWISHAPPDAASCEHFWIADVRGLKGLEMLEVLGLEPGELDCVFGGPPCQGFSRSGKQDPADPRNNLILEFLRLAAETESRAFVMENVPPLITQKTFKPLWDEFLRRAVEAGYNVAANVLDAVNYGVPQYRRRAFVVGTRDGVPHYQFPTPTTWAIGVTTDGRRWDMRNRDDDGADAAEPSPLGQLGLFGGTP